jgi:hypothetical protein
MGNVKMTVADRLEFWRKKAVAIRWMVIFCLAVALALAIVRVAEKPSEPSALLLIVIVELFGWLGFVVGYAPNAKSERLAKQTAASKSHS